MASSNTHHQQVSQKVAAPFLEKEFDKISNLINTLIPHLPKDIKHTWGQHFYELEFQIYAAVNKAFRLQKVPNSYEKRHATLIEAQDLLNDLATLLRKSVDVKFISTTQYLPFISPVGNCITQIEKWIQKDAGNN